MKPSESQEINEIIDSILATLTNGACLTDYNGFIIKVNDYCSKALGYSKEELIGKHFTMILPEEIRGLASRLHDEYMTGKADMPDKWKLLRKDGKEIYVQAKSELISIKNGQKFRFTSIIDITELHRMEKQTQQAIEQSLQAEQARSDFLSYLSHEIRTPMNSILGFAEFLENHFGYLDKEIKSYTKKIRSNGQYLLTFLNDIIELTRIDNGKLYLQKEPISVRELIQDLQNFFKYKLQEKNIQFKITFSAKLPNLILLDLQRMRQMLLNLFSNIIQLANGDSIYINVQVESIQKNICQLVIYINDEENGISKKLKSEVDYFLKNQKKIDFIIENNISLSIVAKLITEMDGKILLEESHNKTSLKLMIYNVEIHSSELMFEQHLLELPGSLIQFEQNTRILIVDDLEIHRIILKNFLHNYTLQIYQADNAKEAIEMSQKIKPDLIFLDLRMPKMSGLEAARKIKELSIKENTKIVILTSSMDNDITETIYIDGILLKPITGNNLKKCLIQNLSHRIINKIYDSNQKNAIIDLDANDKKNMIEKIESLYYEKWLQVKDTFILNQLLSFFDSLKIIANQYKEKELLDYTDSLQLALKGFNTIEARKIISEFPELMEKLKGDK